MIEPSHAASAEEDARELAALRLQDPAAFTRLVETQQTIVMGLGQSLGLRGADLDDAAAEVFLQVYQALPRFEVRSRVGTWVHQIAYRHLLKTRTRWKDRPADTGLSKAEDLSAGPAEDAARRDTLESVWRAVEALEPRQAMAVEWFYRRGWGVAEIAEVMQCPAGTVKTLLHRAREALRARLSPRVDQPDPQTEEVHP